MKPGWTIQDGSTLSLYDDQWFCLKFQHIESNQVLMRFNLPMVMYERLMDLKKDTDEPETAIREFDGTDTEIY